mgnify:CR=1 FL=1
MATIKKQYIASLLAAVALTATLTACSTPATSADSNAKPATSEAPAAVEEAPAENNLIKPFGEVVSYEDGVSISVALVGQFTPSETAIVTEGEIPLVFKIVLTNNSDKPLEPGVIPQANSGGKPATYIADVGNAEYGDLGMFPTAAILPGQTLEWYTAFGVADAADVTMQLSPTSFTYDDAIFTTSK